MSLLASIGLIGFICQWLSWRYKLPSILFLLLSGILVGPVLGLFDPDAVFGELLFPIVSLSVAVILFEGSLTLRFEEIRNQKRVVFNLVSVGVLVTWSIVASAVYFILDMPWQLAVLFGAIMTVTGPTVIMPMLRTVRPNTTLSNILRWEGIVIDPIGAVLAVLVLDYIIISETVAFSGSHVAWILFLSLMSGLLLGGLSAHILGWLLRKRLIPEYLNNFATLAFVLTTFAISNAVQEESGLLAITIMGVWLANLKKVNVEDILDFKENLSLLLISGLFIILAARIQFEQFAELGIAALLIFLVVQFIARPAKIFVSTLGSRLTLQERLLLSWIAPRGIVAAAIVALFAIKLEEVGYAEAPLLVPLAFIIIIGTVVLQSATAAPIAKWLGVANPESRGVLIVGANVVARTIGKSLKDNGFDVMVTDSAWKNMQQARMDGLKTYYGNPVSAHADMHLNLIGYGRMLGLSRRHIMNTLASVRFAVEFGKNNVYRIQTSAEKNQHEKHTPDTAYAGLLLFDQATTFSQLESMIARGAVMSATKLTSSFTYDDYLAKNGDTIIPIYCLNEKGDLIFFIEEDEIKPKAGWTVVSLVSEAEKVAQKEASKEARDKLAKI